MKKTNTHHVIATTIATLIISLSTANAQAQTIEAAKVVKKSFFSDLKNQVVSQVKAEVQTQTMQQLGVNPTSSNDTTQSNNGMKQMAQDTIKEVTNQVTQEVMKGVVGTAGNSTPAIANQLNNKGMMEQILGAATAMAPAILGPKITVSDTANSPISAVTNILNQSGNIGKAVTAMTSGATATAAVISKPQSLSTVISQKIISQSKKLMAKVSKPKIKADTSIQPTK